MHIISIKAVKIISNYTIINKAYVVQQLKARCGISGVARGWRWGWSAPGGKIESIANKNWEGEKHLGEKYLGELLNR